MKVQDLIDGQTNPTIAPLASDGEVTLRLTAKHHDVKHAEVLIQHIEDLILERVGSFSTDIIKIFFIIKRLIY